MLITVMLLPVRYQLPAEHRKRCAQRDALRRRLTIARKAIQQIAETALEHGAPGPDWRNWLRQTEALCRRPPSALDLHVLPALVEQLEAIRSEGDAALAAFFNPVESASAGEVTRAANIATNTLSADKSATCNDAANEPNGGGRSGSSSPAGHDQALTQNAATAALAPGWLARLRQPLRAYLADERPSWSEVVDAAAPVAVIAARGEEIASPGGYLSGMTGKARAGGSPYSTLGLDPRIRRIHLSRNVYQ